jgi:hypothetical protein
MTDDLQSARRRARDLARALAFVQDFRPHVIPILHHEGKGKGARKPTGSFDVTMASNGALAYLSKRVAALDLGELQMGYENILTERRQNLAEVMRESLEAAVSTQQYQELALAIEVGSFMAPSFVLAPSEDGYITRLVVIEANALRFDGPTARDRADELAASIEAIVGPMRKHCTNELRTQLKQALTDAFKD